VCGLIFDLFYKPGHETRAIELQEDMQKMLDAHFHEDSHERRRFWGTFGNTDMQDPKVQQMYYNSKEHYERLQQLKALVDPSDLFHTSLTVKLPKSD